MTKITKEELDRLLEIALSTKPEQFPELFSHESPPRPEVLETWLEKIQREAGINRAVAEVAVVRAMIRLKLTSW